MGLDQPDPVAARDRGHARSEGPRARASAFGCSSSSGASTRSRASRARAASSTGSASTSTYGERGLYGGRLCARASQRPRARPARRLARRRDAASRSPPGRRSTATATERRAAAYFDLPRPPPARSRLRATRSSRLLRRAQGAFTRARISPASSSLLVTPEASPNRMRSPRRRCETLRGGQKDRFGAAEKRERRTDRLRERGGAEAGATDQRRREPSTRWQASGHRGPRTLDLGTLARTGLFDPAVADAAFSLKEGEVTAPVKADLARSFLRVGKSARP